MKDLSWRFWVEVSILLSLGVLPFDADVLDAHLAITMLSLICRRFLFTKSSIEISL